MTRTQGTKHTGRFTVCLLSAVAIAGCAMDSGPVGSGVDPGDPTGAALGGPALVERTDRPDWAGHIARPRGGSETAIDLDVAPDFMALPFDGEGSLQRILVTWSKPADGSLHAGLLSADGRFAAFPSIARGTSGQPAVAVGGPAGQRRIFFAWIEYNPWRLMRVVVDADGQVVAPVRAVGEAVSIGGLHVAGTPTGAVIAYAWSDDVATPNAWDPWTVALDLAGEPSAPVRVASLPGQTTDVNVIASHDGEYAVLFNDNRAHATFLRRYDAAGHPLEAPLSIGASGYQGAWGQVLVLDGSTQHELLIGLPNGIGDTRLLVAPVTVGAPRDLGLIGTALPALVSGTPGFPVAPYDVVATVTGGQATALVGFRHVLERDPNYIGCLEAPPMHAEYSLQAIGLSGQMSLIGPSELVLDWWRTAPDQRAPDGVRVVGNADGKSASALWVDDGLHVRTIALGRP